jgi:ParB-like chromosome segregation protein Spo0J
MSTLCDASSSKRRSGKSANAHRRIGLRVSSTAISELKPDPRNPRVHGEHQVAQLARSIKAFGFVQPVLIDGTQQIVAGHGRIEAAKLLGLRDVPTICIRHLSETQLRALVIADNRLAEQASWDRKLLAEQLLVLSQVELDFDIEATGFDLEEIDLLIEGSASGSDETQRLAEKTSKSRASALVSRQADVWLADEHRVYCGNPLERTSLSLLMNGKPYRTRNDRQRLCPYL